MAMRYIRDFDQKLPSRINNSVGCQIGGRQPDIDFNHLVRDVQAFYVMMKKPITDCPVNRFLKLDRKQSRADKLLSNAAARKLPVCETLAGFRKNGTHITCIECAKIGDAVIALEQPKVACLIHVDNSFNALCDCQGNPHKQLSSVAALAKTSRPGAVNDVPR